MDRCSDRIRGRCGPISRGCRAARRHSGAAAENACATPPCSRNQGRGGFRLPPRNAPSRVRDAVHLQHGFFCHTGNLRAPCRSQSRPYRCRCRRHPRNVRRWHGRRRPARAWRCTPSESSCRLQTAAPDWRSKRPSPPTSRRSSHGSRGDRLPPLEVEATMSLLPRRPYLGRRRFSPAR